MTTNTALPLNGVTVLELGSSLSGPFGCRTLADLGAEVIKVEPVGEGDPARGWGKEKSNGIGVVFHAINKGKRSITVDFQNPEEIRQLKELVSEEIDIVVQNLRAGVADKFSIGANDLTKLKPSLIYCNLAAYGPKGPLNNLPGYDPLLQAFSGLMDVTGPADGEPARVGVPLLDIGSGMWSVIGVLSALNHRHNTGEGSIVDTSMLETALAWQNMSVATYMAGGEALQRDGMKGPLVVPNRGFETSDGILMVTMAADHQFKRFCELIGHPEISDNPKFSTTIQRSLNEAELDALLEPIFRERSRAEWSAFLNEANIPNSPIQSLPEVVEHPQVQTSEIVQTSSDGGVQIVGLPIKFNGKRPAINKLAPKLGEGNKEFLT